MTPTTSETEYAFWTVPGTSFTVTYSLGVFHEIDFQVNEGYRRIPHGGVEVGGLLFGRSDADSAQIEAFRTIECEHASGPSFLLSERDLAGVRDQFNAAKRDPELEGLKPVGWFVAHTRSPLRMNDREAALFDQLFPGAGQIAVLVKPERFQPTHFGFLVRNRDGKIARDATGQAIILPLPGRVTRSSNGPVASIPAPEQKAAAPAPVAAPASAAAPTPTHIEAVTAAPAPVKAAPPLAPAQIEAAPAAILLPASEPERPSAIPLPAPEQPQSREIAAPAPEQPQPREIAAPAPEPEQPREITAAVPVPESIPEPVLNPPPIAVAPEPAPQTEPATELSPAPVDAPAAPVEKHDLEQAKSLVPFSPAEPMPSIDEIKRRRSEKDARIPPQFAYEIAAKGSSLRLALVLFLAATLGCAVGYWAYLQLPSATIALKVRTEPSALLVSWPAGQTRDAVYAALRVDDGQQVSLTPEERAAGHAKIPASGDNVKIELVAQHWMRDSRGIIRYVKAAPAQQAQAPGGR